MERVKQFCVDIYANKVFKLVLLALFCLFLACLSKDYDYDLYARLIVGERFVEAGILPFQDFLSYTPTHDWYDHEWGSGVVFYSMLKLFGPFGLVLTHALTTFVTLLFVLKIQTLQNKAYPFTFGFTVLFLSLFAHLNPSVVRCHMFSFMFFAITLYVLEKTRVKNSNLIWILPPMMIVWNNLHGGVVSGIGMIFVYLVSSIVTKQKWAKYFYVLLLSGMVLIINPYGYKYLEFLISANTKQRTYITEWWFALASRHSLYYFPSVAMGLFTFLISIFALKKFRQNFIKFAILLLTLYLGFMHVKLVSLMMIILAGFFYTDIMKLFDKKFIRYFEKITFVCLLICILMIPYKKPMMEKVDITKFPVLETEFIRINNIKGNILTTFGLGSYVSYKLYPQNLIYMDGRYEEVYNDEEFNNLMDYELVNDNWDVVLRKYPTEILMPSKQVPVYEHLLKQPDWVLVYEGDVCGVFLKSNRLKSFIYPTKDIKYYQKTAFENFGKFGE